MLHGPVMIDIVGTQLSDSDRERICHPATGGVILFSRNYESPQQLTDLVDEVRALRSPSPIIAVDHEGGRVQRFRDGFTAIPPMRRVGREYDRDADSGRLAARQAGWMISTRFYSIPANLSYVTLWKSSGNMGHQMRSMPNIVKRESLKICAKK